LVAHPSNGLFLATSTSGSVWMFDDAGRLYGTADGGDNWIPTGYVFTPALSDPPVQQHFYALAQSGSSVWFAAGSSGLLVSTDNGATFSVASGLSGTPASFVSANPANPMQMLAGATGSSCDSGTGDCPIYYSGNGGGTWTLASVAGAPSVPGAH